jgi:hypothetical protein
MKLAVVWGGGGSFVVMCGYTKMWQSVFWETHFRRRYSKPRPTVTIVKRHIVFCLHNDWFTMRLTKAVVYSHTLIFSPVSNPAMSLPGLISMFVRTYCGRMTRTALSLTMWDGAIISRLTFCRNIREPRFQTYAVFWMLCSFYWVILRSLKFMCRCFGTLCQLNLHNQEACLHRLWRWNWQCPETSVRKIPAPGNSLKERIQHRKSGLQYKALITTYLICH